ncbi:MAG: hypothetical protein JWM19_1500 [Actinomycetia bacterium]|nr:hypothetical protein [Actinomycetes bacterium]
MSFISVSALRARPRSRAKGLVGIEARDRWVENCVWGAWSALVLNVLPYTAGMSVLHIPNSLGKVVTQGSLPLALILAMMANRKFTIRPNLFLCLATLLALESVVTELYALYPVGTGYRTIRFLEFVAVMWLLTPYWGRRDMLLVRCHLKTMGITLGSVLLGLMIAPSKVLGNRLGGVIWPIPGTQVAHYCAVTLGMVMVLWFVGKIKSRVALIVAPVVTVMLILTHTRTALVAGIAGILIAGLSLATALPRVRKFFTALLIIGGTVWLSASSTITNWLARGESTQQLSNLSGRTNFWGPLLATPRTPFREIFGFGLGNGTFSGLPIDSNWMSSYEDQGLWGVTVCALILICLFINASFAPRGVQRALALFFTTYCLIASYTEDGFTAPTTYLLDLMLAASLLVPFGMVREQDA